MKKVPSFSSRNLKRREVRALTLPRQPSCAHFKVGSERTRLTKHQPVPFGNARVNALYHHELGQCKKKSVNDKVLNRPLTATDNDPKNPAEANYHRHFPVGDFIKNTFELIEIHLADLGKNYFLNRNL